MIHNFKAEGLNISEIARRLGLDRKTVRKYLRTDANDQSVRQRQGKSSKLDPYKTYLLERLKVYPQLCTTRLLREIREHAYDGGYAILGDYLRTVRPVAKVNFEIRYETPPGRQAQVDFAMFQTAFRRPTRGCCGASGCSPWCWVTVVACGGSFATIKTCTPCRACICVPLKRSWATPQQLLYDRMKMASIGEDPNGEVIYNQTLSSMLHHYGVVPRACPAYRPQTKGKVHTAPIKLNCCKCRN